MNNFLFTILSFTIYRSAMPLGSAKNLLVSSLETKTKTKEQRQKINETNSSVLICVICGYSSNLKFQIFKF
jgi:hypothetical protein